MQDQLFIRHWATHHETFARDLDKGVRRLPRAFRRIWQTRFGIGRAYGLARATLTGGGGQAMLAGVAASVATTVLFSGTAFVILPAGAVA